jgi:hypothetical protein
VWKEEKQKGVEKVIILRLRIGGCGQSAYQATRDDHVHPGGPAIP